ncbi:MAG: aminoglycoside phosphotransferase family protein [Verrucomicrobiae bacterium]|nr:aminoglycoside phosphotransferase family protein [Verrucomicrobiae bacterium]
MATLPHDIDEISTRFDIPGEYVRAELCGSGHINDTYFAEFRQQRKMRRVVLQRINHVVFKKPVELMDNFARVTHHLQEKLLKASGADAQRQGLRLIPARDGSFLHVDPEGNHWRCLHYIEKSYSLDRATSPEDARQAGVAFARFQKFLADFPGQSLHETIPYFHHTPKRFETFQEVVRDDTHQRRASCAPEIEWALSQESMTRLVIGKLESGELPVRVTHNDTKFNNVLFCEETDEAICVTDLDTVMPGTVLYDFGDQIRTTTTHAPEDETDLGKVVIDLEMFRGLVEGYLCEAHTFLTAGERELLAFSGRLITFQIGLRFLTDYLQGDVYFKTHRPSHNLDRARAQFALCRSMERVQGPMEKIVAECAAAAVPPVS